MATTKALAQKVEKLIDKLAAAAAKGEPGELAMELYFAADELRAAASASAGGDEKLLAVALEGYKAAAERGEANSACSAGHMILVGVGSKPDPDEALRFFEKGAELGNWDAALQAARLHYHHTKKYEAARRFAGMAANGQNPDAGA